jgi:hypothetical protein
MGAGKSFGSVDGPNGFKSAQMLFSDPVDEKKA